MADLDHLEARRLELEENVAKLRKSLQHWRTWDAEYEGLKEELASGYNVQSEKDCTRISDKFGGELVNEKEISDLFGVGKGPLRHPAEVCRLIDRRLDYVQQNVSSITKQVEKVEGQLSEVLEEIDRDDDMIQEPGLPMTEIIEELDEDGNVISSKVTQPENQTAQIIDTLRKAGLSDVDPKSTRAKEAKDSSTNGQISAASVGNQKQEAPKATAETSKPAKKGVSFAEEVQEREVPSRAEEANTSKPSGVNPALFNGSFTNGERVIELDDDDDIIGSQAVIPEDESPEDARLRREMLQYNLNEIGQVVAELDLDENLSEFEDDEDYLDDEYDSEMSEEEDEHGRSIRPGVSKSYREQMQELEKQLRTRVIGNLGPNLEEVDPVYDPEGLRRLVVRGEEGVSDENIKPTSSKGKEAIKPDGSAKKGVRFSEQLDVQEAPNGPEAPSIPQPRKAPIADIIERAPLKAEPPSQPANPPAKVSRFKQNRAAATENTRPEPSQPHVSGSVISDQIVEKPASSSSNARPPEEADELDPELQQRQLASEYYRLRNNMIRQQGGFKETEEEKDDPLMEQFPDGKLKKVSRFKAARMKF